MSIFYDILKLIGVAAFTSFLSFYFLNRGKQKDLRNQKVKELNIILANLLSVWNYLGRLNICVSFLDDKKNDFVFPKETLTFFILKSGLLNDRCFEDLENSINSLKQYDPVAHYDLEGVGKKFDYFRKNYLLPLLQTTIEEKRLDTVKQNTLDLLISDCADYLEHVAKLVSGHRCKEIKEVISENSTKEYERIKEEINQQFYCQMMAILPAELKLSYESFIQEFNKPELRKFVSNLFRIIAENKLPEMIAIFEQNPGISFDEIEKKVFLKF